MALEQPLGKIGFKVAASTLATKQFYAVKLDTSGNIVLAGAGEAVIGILQNDPAAAQECDICYAGVSKAKAGGTITAGDLLMSNASGKLVTQTGTNNVAAVALESAVLDDLVSVLVTACNTGAGVASRYSVLSLPINLASITGAGDVLTDYTPGFAGTIEKISFAVTVPVTTAAKAATLNMEIGATNLTGGVLALTSANSTPLGAVVDATAITADNAFGASDTLSVEASSVTAFTEGAGVLLVVLKAA